MKPSFKEIRSLLKQAVSNRYFSGASLLIFLKGEILLQEEAGFTSWAIDKLTPQPIRQDTLFDLASLTKPLATAQLTAIFIQEGILTLDETVGSLLGGDLSQELSKTSVKALLNHSSGLPDWRPFFSEIELSSLKGGESTGSWTITEKTRRLIYARVHREPFVYQAGSKNVYSDLGFILLGEILERKTGKKLDQLFQEKIVHPLGLKDIGYIRVDPLVLLPNVQGNRPEGTVEQSTPFGKERNFVATENSFFRHKVIQGEVHDDNAFIMGGVAGHAGLFGTALSVYHCFAEWRNGFLSQGKILLSSTVKSFVERDQFPPDRDWGLGWMFPSSPSSAGKYFSRKSFGHLGFTGTSIWFDPQADLGVIFLSNRVHPNRENNALKDFRPLLHDLIYQEVTHEKT